MIQETQPINYPVSGQSISSATGTSSTTVEQTKDAGASPSVDHFGIAYVPKILEALETHSKIAFFTAIFVGYIVISAFGRLDRVEQYWRYFLFLFLIAASYGLPKRISSYFYSVQLWFFRQRFILKLACFIVATGLIVAVVYWRYPIVHGISWFFHRVLAMIQDKPSDG